MTSNLQFMPLITGGVVVLLVTVLVAGALVARWLLGPANAVARRWGLWIVRGSILAIVAVVLLNPVRVLEQPGPYQHPEIFYLFDASASMANPRSRFDGALDFAKQSRELASASPMVIKPFRFGQRLAAIDEESQLGLSSGPVADGSAPQVKNVRHELALLPTDGDTRLVTSLRQISSRFGRVPPQGIVVFSDGRARDEPGLEQLAADFAKLKVPIHVVPVGDTTKGGDVAVSAVVVPPRVRKFTEVEVQVFLRSFGYDGKRSQVLLQEILDGGRVGRTLASLPITLQSGFQSVSLSFRTDLNTRNLRVAVPTRDDEVSLNNNQVNAEITIDRTKTRVLYVEGSQQPISVVRVGERFQTRGPFTDLKQALVEDEDIECVVLASQGGTGRLTRIMEYGQADGVRGFPSTIAELAAFDAIILSSISADAFTEKQLEWIEQWIGQRGGGLCMVGGENSFASGGWGSTPVADMLPIELLPGGYDWMPGEPVKIAAHLSPAPHPLWNILSDEKQNRQVVTSFPQILGINRFGGVRSDLATVLAVTNVSGSPAAPSPPAEGLSLGSLLRGFSAPAKPVGAGLGPDSALPAIVVGRYGRGRTMAVAAPLTAPHAEDLVQKWGQGDNRYFAKLCRNMVYWLTESSAIGRRRLVASADKRFYRPGETITLSAATYDESASPTGNYRVLAMIEPHGSSEQISDATPIKWPTGRTRESGEEGLFVAWGEEFDLSPGKQSQPLHSISLPLADVLSSGVASQSMRVELTAYEEFTQVDSTSIDIQVLHDPFEQQNPFPNHELLQKLATASRGKVLKTPESLAEILNEVEADVGPPIIKHSPAWSNAWMLLLVLGLLTAEWCWRRSLGLA